MNRGIAGSPNMGIAHADLTRQEGLSVHTLSSSHPSAQLSTKMRQPITLLSPCATMLATPPSGGLQRDLPRQRDITGDLGLRIEIQIVDGGHRARRV